LLLPLGLVLIIVGVCLAAFVERRDGVELSDVRWRGADGTPFSALVYRPRGATLAAPAPGILAVHGYVNSRETQSPFAIEFARRGYVVLALDQRGHGYSGGAAASKGFGGPEGLAELRSLPFVDRSRIGLEGHSMGGWTVLAAAAAAPDAYQAMVLEGSSTGAPYARDGTPSWPKNLAVVYSRFDEFAPLMWGVAGGGQVSASPKLQALFGARGPVDVGRLYGDPALGSGRELYTPVTTHPGDHLSPTAVADALDWFKRTLGQPTPRRADDQIWPWHELGTGMALVGVIPFLLGLFDALVRLPLFAALRGAPSAAAERRTGRWWALLLFAAAAPAVSFFAAILVAPPPLPVSFVFPQAVTNWLVVWALANVAMTLVAGALIRGRRSSPKPWLLAALAAVLTTAGVYAVVYAASFALVDFRFWIVALKPFSGRQALAALSYAPPFTLFTVVAFRGVTRLAVRADTAPRQYATALAALASGFAALTLIQYIFLFAVGRLPIPLEALNVIVALQFVPVLTGLAVIHVYCWRRTGGYLAGGLLSGLLATWYIVAGTATQI
jgi:pimeloyl-ACP methyl ester carboxylesterase